MISVACWPCASFWRKPVGGEKGRAGGRTASRWGEGHIASMGAKREGCGNDGREEARGKPLAEVTGDDLRVVVFHRLPQPLGNSANSAEFPTFPQPRRVAAVFNHLRACGAPGKKSVLFAQSQFERVGAVREKEEKDNELT